MVKLEILQFKGMLCPSPSMLHNLGIEDSIDIDRKLPSIMFDVYLSLLHCAQYKYPKTTIPEPNTTSQ